MPSGVPVQIGGKWVGYTDFTEFALQGPGALPAGLTLVGNAFPNAPNSFAVVADGLVGRYFSMNGQDTSHWAIGYDDFAGLTKYGEFLARVWVATNTGNRRVIGPGVFNNEAPVGGWDFNGAHIFKRSSVDYETEVVQVINGGADAIIVAVDMKEAEQAGVWAWVRWQMFEGNPNTTDGHIAKIWYGDFEDEPPGWDAASISATRLFAAAALLGWGVNAVGSADEQRISYYAFSEDPSINVVPPPGGTPPPPGTPDAPTVVVDPRQDRWVGLEGSAYVVP